MIIGNTGRVETEQEDVISLEATSQIIEVAIMESASSEELEAFLESHAEVQEAEREELLMEKSIVRLDKKARLNHAQRMAVFQIAGEKNDPLFKKLLTVWRMERNLEDKLNRKYNSEAMRRARETVRKATNSKSNIVKKAAANVQKQFNSVRV
jgi:hypothetical protein